MTSAQIILVVDDDPDLSEALSDLLLMIGYRPLQAANGREALDLIRAGLRPSLILLDLMMPVMNGWQFREAQLQDPTVASVPVIVLTAAQNLDKPIDAQWVVLKPFELSHLRATVERILRS
jgi:CheY-like chemotaxis protein